jgi:hypothetical protein
MLHDSSDDEPIEGSTIYRAFDRMFGNQDGFPLVVGARTTPVTDSHPSAVHIFQLWQIYIETINPLLKITHIPTVQAQILKAAAELESAPQNIEALMFAIYLIATTSMDELEVQTVFNRPKDELLAQYFRAAQQTLINAGFLRTNDVTCLQAYTLYLVYPLLVLYLSSKLTVCSML